MSSFSDYSSSDSEHDGSRKRCAKEEHLENKRRRSEQPSAYQGNDTDTKNSPGKSPSEENFELRSIAAAMSHSRDASTLSSTANESSNPEREKTSDSSSQSSSKQKAKPKTKSAIAAMLSRFEAKVEMANRELPMDLWQPLDNHSTRWDSRSGQSRFQPRDDSLEVEGIEIFFKSVPDEPSMLQLPTHKVMKILAMAAQEPIRFQRITFNGTLVVLATSAEAAARLLQVRYIMDHKVVVKVPAGKEHNVGRITNVPLAVTDEQLLEFFVSQGVIRVRRQADSKKERDGEVQRVPNFNVILTFRTDRRMPTYLVPNDDAAKLLGERPFVVRAHYEPPVQCMRCQRFGHMARYCFRDQRCKVCAGPHLYKNCDRMNQPKCANCTGPHPATFNRCPVYRLAAVEKRWSGLNETDEPLTKRLLSN